MSDFIITVPPPPSANKLWRSIPGKPRVRSQEYAAWIAVAGWEVRRQMVGVPPIDCRFNVSIQVPVSRRDSDNWVKPLLDICEKAGVVTNDGNMHTVQVEPVDRTDCAIAITLLPDMGGVRQAPRVRGMTWRQAAQRKGAPRDIRGINAAAKARTKGIFL